jgi:hypothetical protein
MSYDHLCTLASVPTMPRGLISLFSLRKTYGYCKGLSPFQLLEYDESGA